MMKHLRLQVFNSLVCSSLLVGTTSFAHNQSLEELIEETQVLRREYVLASMSVRASIDAFKINSSQIIKKIEGRLEKIKLTHIIPPPLRLKRARVLASLEILKSHDSSMVQQLAVIQKANKTGASILEDTEVLIREWDAFDREMFLQEQREMAEVPKDTNEKEAIKKPSLKDKERDKPFIKRSSKLRSSLKAAIKDLKDEQEKAQATMVSIYEIERRAGGTLFTLEKEVSTIEILHRRRASLGDLMTLPALKDNRRRWSFAL